MALGMGLPTEIPNKDTWSQFSFPFNLRVSGVQDMSAYPTNLLQAGSHMVLEC